MGILRDAVGSALGANKINNGLNGPKLPFGNKIRPDEHNKSSRVVRQGSLNPTTQCQSEPPSYDDVYSYQQHNPYQTINPDRQDVTRQYVAEAPYSRHTIREGCSSPSNRYLPLVLPQIASGDGQPFLRGYSRELRQHGISEPDFIQVLDDINIAMVPNPEVQIFQKGARIAGFFLPGAASLGLTGGQIAVGLGAAFGHASMLARVLSKANLQVFIPKGLEICIGKTSNVDAEVGLLSSESSRLFSDTSPSSRLGVYEGYVACITTILPPLQHVGREDPIAMLGRGIANRDRQKTLNKAREKMDKGEFEKAQKLEGELKWLMVRRASPDAVAYWQKTLEQVETAIEQERAGSPGQRNSERSAEWQTRTTRFRSGA